MITRRIKQDSDDVFYPQYYARVGWFGWYDWFCYANIDESLVHFKTIEEASAFLQAEHDKDVLSSEKKPTFHDWKPQ